MQLGPFELEAPIGKGGMGEVWSGRHLKDGTRVAIKVLTARSARKPRYISAFADEVRAVARLNHPQIIQLFDHGKVDEAAQQASEGRLRAGSPYLVMELCSQGALDGVTRPLTWQELKNVLQSVLEALAHAHARGVIHRDIKPANVLLGSDLPSRPGLKLTDFGIAHATWGQERAGSTEETMGTLHYMAPEQFEGRWRDYGPWTDLYALGCMAHELVNGRPPFDGESFFQLAVKHIQETPPLLVPRLPMPQGLDAWIERLMAKSPLDRYRMAADALWALMQLPDPVEVEINVDPHALLDSHKIPALNQQTLVSNTEVGTGPGSTMASADTMDASEISISRATLGTWTDEALTPIHGPRQEERPPLPKHWRRSDLESSAPQLQGVGLGLYGLREVPLVGRKKERDRLWALLKHACTQNTAQVVLLQGASGFGASRLAEWCAERASEVGAATCWKAAHGPNTSAEHSLMTMVAEALRCRGLNRQETYKRICRLLSHQGVEDDYESSALTELLHPSDGTQGPGQHVRFASPRARHVLIARHLERMAALRPMMLLLDDVHWGEDALAFVEVLLERQRRHARPIVVLMTAHDEALAERPEAAAQLRDIQHHQATQTISLGPLPMGDRRALVRKLLGLGGELAQRVEERTEGNPAFAVQLVGDWVTRGVLEPGPTGFRLRQGEEAPLPDNLHEAWMARLERLVARQPKGTMEALELAAAIGQHVPNTLWQSACAHQKLSHPTNVLLAHNLAEPFKGGWSFTQSMVRECLERRARESQRWAKHHRTLARLLARLERTPPEVLGRHLLEAGEPQGALGPLVRSVEALIDASDYRSATRVLRLTEQAITALPQEDQDARWAWLWTQRARIHVQRGNPADAVEWARRARQHAERTRDPDALRRALVCQAHATRAQGNPTDAAALYRQTLGLCRSADDQRGVADCLRALGQMRGSRASRQDRIACFEQALQIYRNLGDTLGMADSLRGLSQLVQAQGDLERAGHLSEMAREHFTDLGNLLGQAHCLNALAEIARYQKRLDEAETGYRQALSLYEAVGSGATTLPRLNLALVLLARGRYIESRRLFDAVREVLERAGRKVFLGAVHANILPTTAAMEDWTAWDHHHSQALTLLSATNLHDPDIAWPAQLAGDLAAAAGDHQRAAQAYCLALDQWRALQRDDMVKKVRSSMSKISVGHP